MALIRLYKIDPKVSVENNSLMSFFTENERTNFFNSLPVKETINQELSANWKKQIFDLDTTITLYNNGRRPLEEYNYLNINQDSFNHYYFITGYEEKGANQLTYFLRKDTLNTYCSNSNCGVDIENSEGLVLREHKDRFKDKSPIYDKVIEDINISTDHVVLSENIRRNDMRSRLVLREIGGEEINGRIYSKAKYFWQYYTSEVKDNALQDIDKFKLSLGWAIHNNNSESISMEFDLYIGKSHLRIKDSETDVSIRRNNYYRLIKAYDTPGSAIIFQKYNPVTGSRRSMVNDIEIIENNGEFSTGFEISLTWGINNVLVTGNNSYHSIYYNTGLIANDVPQPNFSDYEALSLNQFGTIPDYNNIDLFDKRSQKIIELPFILDNKGMLGWRYQYYFEALKEIKIGQNVGFYIRKPNFITNGSVILMRNGNDPKIYTSQYNPFFFNWFNESITLKRERMLDTETHNLINVETSLDVESYQKMVVNLNVVGDYEETEMNELIRFIDMNNSVATIGSNINEYIDYLQNNDLKLMELQEAQATRNLQKQQVNLLTNTLVGAAGGAMLGNAPGAAVGAIGGLITGGINLHFAHEQARDDREKRSVDYQNKLISLQNGMVNVAGGNIDMLKKYDLDNPKVFEYRLKEEDLEYLSKYFHKYGYNTLEYKKIVKQTRRYFDYKKINFNELSCSINLTLDIKNDIAKRFSEGVTIFHKYNNNFDFEQKYENWELTI